AEETVRADEANVRSAEQIVKADEALVDNARVQLGYTTIRSPIDGRTGSLQLNLGNVVRSGGTSDSTLLVINQVQPVYVSFTVPPSSRMRRWKRVASWSRARRAARASSRAVSPPASRSSRTASRGSSRARRSKCGARRAARPAASGASGRAAVARAPAGRLAR